MAINKRIILKIIELVIAIVCIILWENITTFFSSNSFNFVSNTLIVCGTMGGFLVICLVLLIAHVINCVIDMRLNGLFSLFGCVLFVFSGALIIHQWIDASDVLFKESRRYAVATGSMMIINGLVFLIDTIVICIIRT